jgi:uncharacterized protein (TIGR03437 family)
MRFKKYRAIPRPGKIFIFIAPFALFVSLSTSANVSPAQTCSFTLAAPNRIFSSIGGGGAVTITASNPQCGWTARSDSSWISLDQVNVPMPRSLAGRGEIGVILTVDGKTTNNLRINVK